MITRFLLGLVATFAALSAIDPSTPRVCALAIIVTLYLVQEVVTAHTTKPSQTLETLTAEVARLSKESEDAKNKISSLSMAASIRPPARSPFSRT